MDAVKLISSAVLGIDCETVLVGGRTYVIFPPTVERIAGAGRFLSDLGEGRTVAEVLGTMQRMDAACRALSWFIQGDEGLWSELSGGTLEEVTDALSVAVGMIGIQNFPRLSALVRSVRSLIATAR